MAPMNSTPAFSSARWIAATLLAVGFRFFFSKSMTTLRDTFAAFARSAWSSANMARAPLHWAGEIGIASRALKGAILRDRAFCLMYNTKHFLKQRSRRYRWGELKDDEPFRAFCPRAAATPSGRLAGVAAWSWTLFNSMGPVRTRRRLRASFIEYSMFELPAEAYFPRDGRRTWWPAAVFVLSPGVWTALRQNETALPPCRLHSGLYNFGAPRSTGNATRGLNLMTNTLTGLIFLPATSANSESNSCTNRQQVCFAFCEKNYDNSPRWRGACRFYLAKRMATGCWESKITATRCGFSKE
jgi:hypothetical protein